MKLKIDTAKWNLTITEITHRQQLCENIVNTPIVEWEPDLTLLLHTVERHWQPPTNAYPPSHWQPMTFTVYLSELVWSNDICFQHLCHLTQLNHKHITSDQQGIQCEEERAKATHTHTHTPHWQSILWSPLWDVVTISKGNLFKVDFTTQPPLF